MQHGRLAVVDSDALDGLATAQLRDAIAATDPHALLATTPNTRIRLRSALPEFDRPVVAPGSDQAGGELSIGAVGDVQVAVAGSTASVADLAALETAGEIDATTHTYVLTDALDLSVRPTELRTVRQGVAAYRRAIATGERDADHALRGSYTHLSTNLPTDYYGEWGELTVRGVAPGSIDGAPSGGPGSTETAIASLELGVDGTVSSGDLRAASLGLRAIDGVGEQRARTLREAGYPDREALAKADVATLADLDDLARSTATSIVNCARAFEAGRVRRRTDERLPGPEPIFVDIETDGLSPSTAWLIGVLDREADQPYRSFLAADPDRPVEALESFCAWYAERVDQGSQRPLVAYNGQPFDFPVLAELIEMHCPEYRTVWADAWTFDPYAWAIRDGNASFPARTNRLEDVATALGFDDGETTKHANALPLDGAEVARVYRTWQADPSPETEPDWEALEAYCEADVRALAHVYDAIDAADRTAGDSGGAVREPTAETTQGSLGDF
ncbi:hypothetical protein L593_11815 [Salinarchaeum sp. Harcht-Bsk1]|uniref:ribonuclease H-like domain-containing protein n=1 Tax=Salinarchaeum sp. Harcht-Bsk1 TaxID=1333523 RepID=UPI0003423783|nr:ribonuclease H-like domain-containing protein [Salinarchaeum sp. Harcht-Bsk1]AGN02306.1 hypothetical protein L593_11815 [Salinarchaeum sp. Harcht-Bsk1]